jgi:hypothetical protein
MVDSLAARVLTDADLQEADASRLQNLVSLQIRSAAS